MEKQRKPTKITRSKIWSSQKKQLTDLVQLGVKQNTEGIYEAYLTFICFACATTIQKY